MTTDSNRDALRLNELLDQAFDLDEPARAAFVETVPEEFRDELKALLQASEGTGPLERRPMALASEVLAEQVGTMTAGQRLGSNRLIRLLGEGGMASVWLAETGEGESLRQVAVKCIKVGRITPESQARFLREQQILKQLRHPNIARLYDAGISAEGVPFIVMEWIDGAVLTRYADDRRLNLTQRLKLFQKICAVVGYAHQNLIVHRDLKPGNILVGGDGEPKLLDFGIAKSLDETTEAMTRTGMQLLTPEYAAPEQFSGEMITTATDVFALGAILYELLCGLGPRSLDSGRKLDRTSPIVSPSEALRRAAKSTSPGDARHPKQLAERRASFPERLRRQLQGDLSTIVLKALQVEPARRYATPQALSEDIERYLQHQPILARKDAWTYRLGKFLQRHVAGVALTTLVGMALLAATAVSIYQARRAEAEANRAIAVEGFLTNLFEVSDSGLPREKIPSTETLLEEGVKRVQDEFKDAPLVKLRLLLLLGRIQENLGLSHSAEGLLKQALVLADENLTQDNEIWLQAHSAWAMFLYDQGRSEESIQHLSPVIAQYRAATRRENVQLIEALESLGIAYDDSTVITSQYAATEVGAESINRGKREHAVVLTRQALAMAMRLFGERNPTTQDALQKLGVALMTANQYEEAESVSRKNVELSRQLYGENHAKFASGLTSLAEVLSSTEKYAEAEKITEQALAIAQKIYDQPNGQLLYILTALGKSRYFQYKFTQAQAVYEQVLTIQTTLSKSDPAIIRSLFMLDALANKQHHYDQSEAFLQQALEKAKEIYGPAHPQAAEVMIRLAVLWIKTGRYIEAQAILQDALKIAQSSSEDQDTLVGLTLSRLAAVESALNPSSTAPVIRIDEALSLLGKSLAPENIYMVRATLIKVDILNRLQRFKEAHELLTPLIVLMRRTGLSPYLHTEPVAERGELITGLTELGHAQAGLQDTAAASASWSEALALLHDTKPLDSEAIAELKQSIAALSERSH